jgi:diaminopimelate decarboxylase
MLTPFPFTAPQLEALVKQYGTPFHIYNEQGIRDSLRRLDRAFSWNGGFKEFFAVKALPNPYILEICREEGAGADCSSGTELELAAVAGISGEDIMFTSNDTPANEFRQARDLRAIINLDEISHIPFLKQHAGVPEVISFRYNPGKLRQGNAIIGKPEEAKYGLTREQMIAAYAHMKHNGVRRFGIHTMLASNERDPQYFIDTAAMLFSLMDEISSKAGVSFEFANLGGGIGIPYRPEDQSVDVDVVGRGVQREYKKHFKIGSGPRIFMENGRLITGPYGWLVTRVLHLKHTYRDYVGLDACMAHLPRPAIYGAYHHITVLGKEEQPQDHIYDVTGSLCENNDKFAINRPLPEVKEDDICIIHCTGAHSLAMASNYNGKLLCMELLHRPGNEVQMIRRAQTPQDLFATLTGFPGSKFF